MGGMLTQEQKFMAGLMDEFKDFVLDSMADGMHDGFPDHHDFLRESLSVFLDLLNEDMSPADEGIKAAMEEAGKVIVIEETINIGDAPVAELSPEQVAIIRARFEGAK